MARQSSLPVIHAPVLAILLFQVAALFCRSFLHKKLTEAGIDQELARNLSYLVVPFIEFVLLWPILKGNRTSLASLLQIPYQWPGIFLRAILLGFLARVCGWCVLIAATAFGWFQYAAPGQGNGPWFWFNCPPLPALLLGVLVTVLLIPPVEEIINRGLIFGELRKTNCLRAVILSAILFAVMHNPDAMPAAFFIGIFLAIQTLNTGSLLPSIISHATYNLLRIIDWYCWHTVWNPEMPTTTSNNVGAMALVVGILAFSIAIWITVQTGPKRTIRPGPDS